RRGQEPEQDRSGVTPRRQDGTLPSVDVQLTEEGQADRRCAERTDRPGAGEVSGRAHTVGEIRQRQSPMASGARGSRGEEGTGSWRKCEAGTSARPARGGVQ